MKTNNKGKSSKKAVLEKIKTGARKVRETAGESAIHTAVKNVQKIREKKSLKPTDQKPPEPVVEEPAEDTPIRRRRRVFKPKTGIVYVGHIPHGFYEEQMQDYFKQFGQVQRVRIARSKKTGRSRGYGYVEFTCPEVAKIAAETMHNYLMCNRLLKATYIPPEKQHEGFFFGKPWTAEKYPGLKNNQKTTRVKNSTITKQKHKRFVKRTMNKLSGLEKKLKEKGVDLNIKESIQSSKT